MLLRIGYAQQRAIHKRARVKVFACMRMCVFVSLPCTQVLERQGYKVGPYNIENSAMEYRIITSMPARWLLSLEVSEHKLYFPHFFFVVPKLGSYLDIGE